MLGRHELAFQDVKAGEAFDHLPIFKAQTSLLFFEFFIQRIMISHCLHAPHSFPYLYLGLLNINLPLLDQLLASPRPLLEGDRLDGFEPVWVWCWITEQQASIGHRDFDAEHLGDVHEVADGRELDDVLLPRLHLDAPQADLRWPLIYRHCEGHGYR